MKVLVLGSDGLVGAAVTGRLRAEGIDVVSVDIGAGQDVMDPGAVRTAAAGCDAIVNAAGGSLPGAEPGRGTIALNVTGNGNVLEAARAVGARRVVTFSSVNALGVFRGEAKPDHLPIDDDHHDSIARFAVDPASGALAPTGRSVALPKPVCLLHIPEDRAP